jgi:hypothetical protein
MAMILRSDSMSGLVAACPTGDKSSSVGHWSVRQGLSGTIFDHYKLFDSIKCGAPLLMRESCTYSVVREAPSNGRSYRDH